MQNHRSDAYSVRKKTGLRLNTSRTKHDANDHGIYARMWKESAHRLWRTLFLFRWIWKVLLKCSIRFSIFSLVRISEFLYANFSSTCNGECISLKASATAEGHHWQRTTFTNYCRTSHKCKEADKQATLDWQFLIIACKVRGKIGRGYIVLCKFILQLHSRWSTGSCDGSWEAAAAAVAAAAAAGVAVDSSCSIFLSSGSSGFMKTDWNRETISKISDVLAVILSGKTGNFQNLMLDLGNQNLI